MRHAAASAVRYQPAEVYVRILRNIGSVEIGILFHDARAVERIRSVPFHGIRSFVGVHFRRRVGRYAINLIILIGARVRRNVGGHAHQVVHVAVFGIFRIEIVRACSRNEKRRRFRFRIERIQRGIFHIHAIHYAVFFHKAIRYAVVIQTEQVFVDFFLRGTSV